MDFDSFLTYPRWDILQIVAERPSSPIEIAAKLNTTVSYVSQQLKLLDVAGLVEKKKTGAFEKGKPRTLFSVVKELVYLTVLTRDFSKKKLVTLNSHQKGLLTIWMLEDVAAQAPVEKVFLKLEEDLKDISGIYVSCLGLNPKILVATDSKKISSKISTYVKTLNQKIDLVFVSSTQLEKTSLDDYVVLYKHSFSKIELKGGQI